MRNPDDGDFAIEAALVVPVVAGLILLVVLAGRLQTIGGTVDSAAREGARSASLDRSGRPSQDVAADAVNAALTRGDVSCPSNKQITVIPGTIGDAPNRLKTITVVVHCTFPVNDLFPVGVPGAETESGRFTSVIDRYRTQ